MEETAGTTVPPADKAAAPPDQADLTGRVLGDFQLLRRIGQGGMGQVYLARQITLKRSVAIKVLRPDLAANETTVKRFKAEAEAVAAINHPNIVHLHAIGEAGGLHYMVLEYVEGRNLREYLSRKGPPDLPIALSIMRQVAAALQRAGESGFVHRDIKPENILLTRRVEVKVTDFGLSRCFATDEPLNLTQSGVTMGTPLYMSPEQVQGHKDKIDHRSDIYSFGVTSYHLLAGEPPFRGQTAFEVALQHVQAQPKPLRELRPDLPPELCAIVHKMMAKRPEDRYQTAREILRDLNRLRTALAVSQVGAAPLAVSLSGLQPTGEQPAPAPPRQNWRKWLGALALLLLAAGAGAGIHRLRHPTKQAPAPQGVPTVSEADPRPASLAEKERKLLERLADKQLLPAAGIDAILDLAMLYMQERRFDDALALFKSPPKEVKEGSLAKIGGQFGLLSRLGEAVVLSREDKAEASNRIFMQALVERPAAKGAKQPKGTRPFVDRFLWDHPVWRKAVADALTRNARNLPDKPMDSRLAAYRNYSPTFPNEK